MRSIILRDIGFLELADVPKPEASPGYALLRVNRCALCRTDAKMWAQGQRDLRLPRILGHEICGIREETNERFVVWPGEACGKCVHCLGKAENLCSSLQIIGFNRDGGLAEWVLVPESSLIGVPTNLRSDVACLAEPLACTLNALDQCRAVAGNQIAIFGGGPVGLLMALAVKATGASPFIIETNSERIHKSASFRNHLNIQAGCSIGSSFFDVAINACSSHEAFFSGIAGLRAGGRFCLFSGFSGEQTFSPNVLNEIHYRQLRVVGAYGCTKSQIARSLAILEEFQSSAELLIQEEIPLEGTVNGLTKILEAQTFKIIVNMDYQAH